MATFVQQMSQTKLNITNQSLHSHKLLSQKKIKLSNSLILLTNGPLSLSTSWCIQNKNQLWMILLCWLKFIPKMPVYISQMVPYFSLFDTFMDQTQDSSIIAAADTDTGKLDIEQNWISNFQN